MSNQNDHCQHWQTFAIKIEGRLINYDLESPLKNIACESSKYIVYTVRMYTPVDLYIRLRKMYSKIFK